MLISIAAFASRRSSEGEGQEELDKVMKEVIVNCPSLASEEGWEVGLVEEGKAYWNEVLVTR